MSIYSFWNNKGGTGKTSLAFQTTCCYANTHSNAKILVIDLCPQANLSELFLGGLEKGGGENLLKQQGLMPRKTIGGYFENRISTIFKQVGFNGSDYIVKPYSVNSDIPKNIDLIPGDPLVELQAMAMNTLANTKLPGVNAWLSVIDWLNDLLEPIKDNYEAIFIDTNPSFSIYTQIALAASDRLIIPMMSDDSSRRAFHNALSLIYGISLPSPLYKQYTFSSQMNDANRKLPLIHMVVRNRMTQYMGDASAYQAVLNSITDVLNKAMTNYPQHFTYQSAQDAILSVRDFQTTGVVSFARGCPFFNMKQGKLSVQDKRVQITEEQLVKINGNIQLVVDKIQ